MIKRLLFLPFFFCACAIASPLVAADPTTRPIPSTEPKPEPKTESKSEPKTEPWHAQPNQPPAFGVLLSPGVAPCVVHVNALRFPLAKGTPLTAWYVWDFGDPKGQYNSLPGFNAAHVYQSPGNYTITLTVTDEAGTIRSATAGIVISPNRRREIFVAPDGSDLNVGTSPDAPVRSINKAFSLLTDNCEILLKAGGIYPSSNVMKLNHSDVVIGKYSDGADPLVNLIKQDTPKPPHGFISIDAKCNGATIQNLTFDSPYPASSNGEAPKIGIDAIVARGRNITVRDCTFFNVDCAVNANGSPIGLMVQGCKAPLKTGLRAYLVWTQGTDFVCLGNSAANSTREHIVRLSGVDRALIAANDFTNLDRRPGDKYDTSKGTIEMHAGSYAYITHNTVRDGTIRVGPLGIHEDALTATSWAVIEDNQITNTYIVAYPGSHHVMIRNNIIHNDTMQAIVLQAPDGDGRTNQDIRILNNTAIDQGESGALLKVWGRVDGIVLKNNLFIAPSLKIGINGAAALNTAENDLGSFSQISHNIWPEYPGDEFVINKQTRTARDWTSFPQVKNDQFASLTVNEKNAPVEKITGETQPGVLFDFYGHRRASTPAIGAVEDSNRNN